MKIRHILVRHQFEAEDLLRKLSEGIAFEVLAARFSICPSAAEGGDLGDITKSVNKMAEEFKETVMSLMLDEVSAPVRTKFGYHLIQRYA
jgi:peptidyl-prolyl cis-trans isomerase C